MPLSVEIGKLIDFTHSFQTEKISMLIKKRQDLIEQVKQIFLPFTLGLWAVCLSKHILFFKGTFKIKLIFDILNKKVQ